jgi:hypothetical protein
VDGDATFYRNVSFSNISTIGVSTFSNNVISLCNIGIKTHDPSESLHVIGKLFVTQQILTSNNVPGYSFVGDSNTGIFNPEDHNIGFAVNGIEALRIKENTNIGIGTSNPLSKLDVYNGDILSRNVIKLTKYSSNSSITIKVNWETATLNNHTIFIKTSQELEEGQSYGIKYQKHTLHLDNLSNITQQIAIAHGNSDTYTKLFVNTLGNTSNSVDLQSFINTQNSSNIMHIFQVDVLLYPNDIGRVWLS